MNVNKTINFHGVIAVDNEGGFATNTNSLPWHVPAELSFFKNYTKKFEYVLMGANTYRSLAGPLKDRKNIIITSDPTSEEAAQWIADGCHVISNWTSSLSLMLPHNTNVAVIGGANLISQMAFAFKTLTISTVNVNSNAAIKMNVDKITSKFLTHEELHRCDDFHVTKYFNPIQ